MLTNRTPLTFGGGSTSVKPEGFVPPPNVSMETQVAIVSPKYFATLQLPLEKGRDFTEQDSKESQRVIIVNQTFAERYWPGQEPIGKQVVSDLTNESFTVVGIARNAKYNQLNEAPIPFVYLPLYQVYRAGMTINARVSGDPLTFAKSVDQAIHELDPDVVVFDITTLDLRRQLSTIAVRIGGTFVGAFGLLALVLAAIGVYGVTSYTTNQRTHEIGIRLALGASRADVLRLMLRRGIVLTLLGLVIGLGHVVWSDSLPAVSAPGREQHGCADLRGRRAVAQRGRARSVLHSRAPSHAGGSYAGIEVRVGLVLSALQCRPQEVGAPLSAAFAG